jgi:hypothetical protein
MAASSAQAGKELALELEEKGYDFIKEETGRNGCA